MKKLFITIFLLVITTLSFAQDRFVRIGTIDSSDYYTSAVQVPTGYELKNIIFPALTATTTSFMLKVGIEPASMDTLWYDSAVFNPTIDVDGCPYALNANEVWGWEWVMAVFSVQQTADAEVQFVFIKKD